MITDNIQNAKDYYSLGENFQKGFEFLLHTNLSALENGKYEIDGEKLFVSVQDYNTKPIQEGRFEAHKKYADIQFIIEGKEKLGYTNINNLIPSESYNEENDITFFESYGKGNFVNVQQNDFVIFMPQDGHMPCLSIDENIYVKKAVVKVLL